MGILAEILEARDATVTTLNGGTGALTIAGTAPISVARVGQNVNVALSVPGAARGHLMHFSTGWGSLAPPANSMSVLMGNGTGADLSWVLLQDGSHVIFDRVGNVLNVVYEP